VPGWCFEAAGGLVGKKGGLCMRIRPWVFAVCLLAVSGSAMALRSLTTESFTDPDYKGYTFKKAVLLVQNASIEGRVRIEERLTAALKDHGVELVAYRALFPPTRDWDSGQRAEILQREGVEAELIVTVGATAASVIPVAMQSFGTTHVNGSAYSTGNMTQVNGTAFSNSTSYTIVHARSSAEFSAVLLDLTKGKTAWYADISTKAGGTLFVGEKGDDKAVVKGIVEGLEKEGHFVGKGK